MKSRMPAEIPFRRLDIKGLKTVKDIVQYLDSWQREFDKWYAIFKDDRENGGFSHEDWRSKRLDNGDMVLQKLTGNTWITVQTFKGS